MEERVIQLKRDLLKLKAASKTTGDSATAYRISLVLAGRPSDYNYWYRWDIYVEALANVDNAIFMAEANGGYSYMTGSSLGDQPMITKTWAFIDVNNPTHIMVAVDYMNPSFMKIYGDPSVTITSNVPFQIKSSSRTSMNYNYSY